MIKAGGVCKIARMHFHFPRHPRSVCFFLFSDIDDVEVAVNNTVRTYMEKFAVIWKDCGFNDISIQQRCEAVKKHVQVNTVLRLSLK
jgi:hypothetical protein